MQYVNNEHYDNNDNWLSAETTNTNFSSSEKNKII